MLPEPAVIDVENWNLRFETPQGQASVIPRSY